MSVRYLLKTCGPRSHLLASVVYKLGTPNNAFYTRPNLAVSWIAPAANMGKRSNGRILIRTMSYCLYHFLPRLEVENKRSVRRIPHTFPPPPPQFAIPVYVLLSELLIGGPASRNNTVQMSAANGTQCDEALPFYIYRYYVPCWHSFFGSPSWVPAPCLLCHTPIGLIDERGSRRLPRFIYCISYS
jgi:hypothetical protein